MYVSSDPYVSSIPDEAIFSILVLKDGQIVEQGSHSELLAQGGIFAAMWADQITASEDGIPVAETAAAGYSVEDAAAVEETAPVTDEPTQDVEPAEASYAEVAAKAPEADGAIAPAEDAPVNESAEPEASVAFPSSPTAEELPAPDEEVASPVAFPGGEEAASPDPLVSPPLQNPGVTFVSSDPPSGRATPDPATEPKRKRISSQNFQRLARRISISGRREGSTSSIPNILPRLKRESSGPAKESSSGDGSLARTDSPSASVQGDDGSTKKEKEKAKLKKEKKERKEQKKRGTVG